jgi:hypothetical protein
MIEQFYPSAAKFEEVGLFLGTVKNSDAGEAFSENKVEFLDDLSRRLLTNAKTRIYSEVVAFAFWIRKANIKLFVEKISQDKNSVHVPRGIAFHITPSNVDIMFLYSWALSLLAGNTNIVRISQTKSELVDLVIEVLLEQAKDSKWDEISSGNKLISYPHDSKINAVLSAAADLRIIWGGDETVKQIRSFPTHPFSKDISFSDKRSYSAINSAEFLKLNEEEQVKLIHSFYNDSYWFDQMACSSPQVVYFIGEGTECSDARKLFWETLNSEIKKNSYTNQLSVRINHLVAWYANAAQSKQERFKFEDGQFPTVIKIDKEKLTSDLTHCGGGFFYEVHLPNLNELKDVNFSNDQTLTYFGFGQDEIKNLIKAKGKFSFCRVVPVGQGLSFDFIWDGYNLLNEFSKIVKIL